MMKNILNFTAFKQEYSVKNSGSTVQRVEQSKPWAQALHLKQKEMPLFELNTKEEQHIPELASVSNGVEYGNRLRIKSDQTAQHLIICGKMSDVCLALEKMEQAAVALLYKE